MNIPDHLIYPPEPFAELYQKRYAEGMARLAHSKVAFVGLARNCAVRLAENLGRLEYLVRSCKSWALHIEENDSTDQTLEVLQAFAEVHKQATFTSQTLGREHYGAEFAGRRTIALAEYRDACQRWVRDCAADADYVIVIDWDQWGGWSHTGLLNGIGWLVEMPGAYGMASVSLVEHPVMTIGEDKKPAITKGWLQYDCWALRGIGQPDCYWDDYTAGLGGWKHQWIPPVGSEPVVVASAFGGLCIYRTEDYLLATYDGTTDCEHTAAHRSIARKTGKRLYINPSQRTVMRWLDACDPPAEGVE
jgi:hypothetical protein